MFGFDIPINLALYIVAKLCMMILSLLFHFFDKEIKRKNRKKTHPDVKYDICSVCLYLVSVHAVILSYCLVVISRWRCDVQLNGAHLL